jgi:hypothetical protein
MTVIALTTDFGLQDAYVGLMKGVILGICPSAQIVDLTHGVPPQNLLCGAMVLESAFRYFPAGTIHVGVVDPGVGSERRGICLRVSKQWFIGPDNGLISLALASESEVEAWWLNNPAYWLANPSDTFHGRDVFSPIAAHLANDESAATQFGPPIDPATLIRLDLPEPEALDENNLRLTVLDVDRFGNLITNLTGERLQEWVDRRTLLVEVGDERIAGLGRTFADAPEGRPVVYVGSSGRLEVAVRNGNAAERFGIGRGDRLTARHRP